MEESSVFSVFLKAAVTQSFKTYPTSAQSLYDTVQEDPTVMRWPILVDYKTRQVSMNQAGVKKILQNLRRKRDGEPIEPKQPAPQWTLPPKPAAWVDYD